MPTYKRVRSLHITFINTGLVWKNALSPPSKTHREVPGPSKHAASSIELDQHRRYLHHVPSCHGGLNVEPLREASSLS